MSRHRHTVRPDGTYKVVAHMPATPDVVADRMGDVLLLLDQETSPAGNFVVIVNGGTLGDGRDEARFVDPMAAFDFASSEARIQFAEWVHEEGHNVGPLEQDRDLPVLAPAPEYGPDSRFANRTNPHGYPPADPYSSGEADRPEDITPLTWHTPLCESGCDWCEARREQLAAAAARGDLGPDPMGDHHGRNE